jgi:hypothetical protein
VDDGDANILSGQVGLLLLHRARADADERQPERERIR